MERDIPQPSITCPRCKMRSYNPNDIRERYCGNCHDWIADTPTVRLGIRLDEYIAAAEAAGPIPEMFTADSVLDSISRDAGWDHSYISAEERERLRPAAEKLAKGLSIKASGIMRRFDDGPGEFSISNS